MKGYFKFRVKDPVEFGEYVAEQLNLGIVRIGKAREHENTGLSRFAYYETTSQLIDVNQVDYQDNVFEIVYIKSYSGQYNTVMFCLNEIPVMGFCVKNASDVAGALTNLFSTFVFIIENGVARTDFIGNNSAGPKMYPIYIMNPDNTMTEFCTAALPEKFTKVVVHPWISKGSGHDAVEDIEKSVAEVRHTLRGGNHAIFNSWNIYRMGSGLSNYNRYEVFAILTGDSYDEEYLDKIVLINNENLSEYNRDEHVKQAYADYASGIISNGLENPFTKQLKNTDPLSELSALTKGGESDDPLSALSALAEGRKPTNRVNDNTIPPDMKPTNRVDDNRIPPDVKPTNSVVEGNPLLAELDSIVDKVVSGKGSYSDAELRYIKRLSNKLFGLIDNTTTSLFG